MAEQIDVRRQIEEVFNIADTLRGTYSADKYRDVIIPMVIIRRLECALADTKDKVVETHEMNPSIPDLVLRRKSGYAFYNTSRYTLKSLLASNNLKKDFKTYLEGFSSNIREILSDLDFDKQIDKMAKGSILTGVVRRFSELPLDPAKVNNVAMGYMFEEVIRRFSENTEAGDHYTPREVVRLLVKLGLAEGCDDLYEPGKVIKVGDVACGTGGMLSVAMEELNELCPNADVYLYGQEIVPDTHAVCLADMLIKGQNAENIRQADTMKEDCFEGEFMRFEFVNPPFGRPWGGEKAADGVEKAVKAEHKKVNGRFPAGLPASSDMQMLFMQHIAHKLDPKVGRACVISNGSPLFAGGTSSGESQIRRWLLENDLIEAIIALPGDLFYNTNIAIYVWVISKNKRPERRGKVQLIDARNQWVPMRRSLGNKRKFITDKQIQHIVDTYAAFEETERCKIFPAEEFLYHEWTVYQPLQRNYMITNERIDRMVAGKFSVNMHDMEKLEELRAVDEGDRDDKQAKKLAELEYAEPIFEQMVEMLRAHASDDMWQDEAAFKKHLKGILTDLPPYRVKQTSNQTKDLYDKLAAHLSEMDKTAPLRYDRSGSMVVDSTTKDAEIVKLSEDVADYMEREVLPYVPDAIWRDEEDSKTVKTGAEIPFTRFFYQFNPPEPSNDLLERFLSLEKELSYQIDGWMKHE